MTSDNVSAISTEADGLVSTADPRLNEALAGGLRRGELCAFFSTMGLMRARRAAINTVSHYIIERNGRVLYFAMTPPANAEVTKAPLHLRDVGGPLIVCAGQSDLDRIGAMSEHYVQRSQVGLIVLDSIDAIVSDRYDSDWERAAEISREAKALSRAVATPVLALSPVSPNVGLPYSDFLVADADVLVRAAGDYLTLIKNRHGISHLKD